jgi:hypothetical protein
MTIDSGRSLAAGHRTCRWPKLPGFGQAVKKDRLVGLLSFEDALWFVQRRAEAGQLQQRRVNFHEAVAADAQQILG